MSILKPEEIGFSEEVAISIPVQDAESLVFMIPKPAARRLETLAATRGVSVEQVVGEWIQYHMEGPALKDEELKSYSPKDISGCHHGLPPFIHR